MISKNDRVVLIRECGKLDKLGVEYEIGDINESYIIIRNVTSKVAVAAVKVNEFDQYFSKRDQMEKWTEWKPLAASLGEGEYLFRTKGNKVEVKTVDRITGRATCHKDDEFVLSIGLNLAYLRCKNKIITAKLQALQEEKGKNDVLISNLINMS